MRYNSHLKQHIVLQEGEHFCKKCGGAGMVARSNSFRKEKLICEKCLGEGKLDWIEKAVGKRSLIIELKIEKGMLVEREKETKRKMDHRKCLI